MQQPRYSNPQAVYNIPQQQPPPGFYPAEPHGKQRSSHMIGDSGSADNGATTDFFANGHIRRAFIRKVYSILTIQLMFVLGVVALFIFSEPVKKFVQTNSWVSLTALVLFIGTYLTLVCCESFRRKTPQNYFCLAALTLSLSYITGATSSWYDTHVVFLALAITALVTLSLTIFAIQTKIDFTLCSGCLCVATMVVIMMGFAMSLAVFVIGYSRILSIVYAGIAALLFSMYLVYDTQLLMGGKRISLSEEEYILAATQLFLDIVMLFLYILQILGLVSRE